MIRVDTSAVAPSAQLLAAQAALDAASDADGPGVVAKSATPWISIRGALRVAQYDKCAYCEDRLRERMTEIDHIRPKSASWYWWLAFQVRNLVATCRACNNAKHNRWELQVGTRQLNPREEPWTVSESAMLVDPTVEDPGSHLTYVRHAGVWGIAALSERGKWTISTLELDRDSFIHEINGLADLIVAPEVARLKAAAAHRDRVLFDASRAVLDSLSADNYPFAAFFRVAISHELAQ